MPLSYILHKNTIHKTASDGVPPSGLPPGEAQASVTYRAVAKEVAYVSIDDAIEALTQPGSILKQTECFAVIHRFLDYLNEQLAEGNGFLSPYFRLTPGVRGVFERQDDAYDPRRHRPSVNFRPGKKMQQAMQRMKVRRIDGEVPAPVPTAFQDWKSEAKNQRITPDQVGVVMGEQLKITNPADPEQGVFFIHLPTRQAFRTPDIFHNYPKQLLVPIPAMLPPGPYQLEVRSAFNTTGEVRTGRLPMILTVPD